jgi:hypothetical protein
MEHEISTEEHSAFLHSTTVTATLVTPTTPGDRPEGPFECCDTPTKESAAAIKVLLCNIAIIIIIIIIINIVNIIATNTRITPLTIG